MTISRVNQLRSECWKENDGLSPVIPLFRAAGGAATGRSAASAGGAGSALEFSADGKREGGHNSTNLLALTLGAGNLFRRVHYQFFKLIFTLVTLIFEDRHFRGSFKIKHNIF